MGWKHILFALTEEKLSFALFVIDSCLLIYHILYPETKGK